MIQIQHDVRRAMIEDAIESFPNECCGFLLGKETGEERLVTEIIIAGNHSRENKKRRYEISAKEYLRAEQYAEENELQLLGIYHSHPNHPPRPSEHDRVVAQPYFSYIIISVLDKEFFRLLSWRLNDEQQFEEEKVTQDYLIKQTN